jgi:hypothetical protein
MDATKTLLERVKSDILKSGYPLELSCQQQLSRHPWVGGFPEYYPTQSGSYRRIDIEACLQANWKVKKRRYFFTTDLWIECKKSESSPWVFLEGGFPNDPNIISNINGIERQFDSRFFTRKSHHYSKVDAMADNYLVPFKQVNSKEGMQIFDAVSNLSDYFTYRVNRCRQTEKTQDRLLFIRAVHLCIVLHGILLFGKLEGGDLQLSRVERTCVHHSVWTNDKYLNCCIDVVTKDSFADYVASVERTHKFLAPYLARRLSQSIGNKR